MFPEDHSYSVWSKSKDWSRKQDPSTWNKDGIRLNVDEFCSKFKTFESAPVDTTSWRLSSRCFHTIDIVIRMNDMNVVGVSVPIKKPGAPKRWTFSGDDEPPYFDLDIYVSASNPKRSRVTDVEKTERHRKFIESLGKYVI